MNSRDINASGKTGFQEAGAWKWLADAAIVNQGNTPTKLGYTVNGRRAITSMHWGFGVSAGSGQLASDPALPPERYFQIWSKWAKACKSVPKRRVPLSARGLSGGAADHFGDGYTCPAPRKVFVRVRAVFSAPTTLRLDRRTLMLKTEAPVQQASFAIRNESGKPFAFASVSESGKARIFTADSCIAE